jgi:hypothetical protein
LAKERESVVLPLLPRKRRASDVEAIMEANFTGPGSTETGTDPRALDRPMLQTSPGSSTPPATEPTTLGVPAASELQAVADIGCKTLVHVRYLLNESQTLCERFPSLVKGPFPRLASDNQLDAATTKAFDSFSQIISGSEDRVFVLAAGLDATALASYLERYSDEVAAIPELLGIIRAIQGRLTRSNQVDLLELSSSCNTAHTKIVEQLSQSSRRLEDASAAAVAEFTAASESFRVSNVARLKDYPERLLGRAAKLDKTPLHMELLAPVLERLHKAVDEGATDKSQYERNMAELLKAAVALRKAPFNSAALENIIMVAVEGLASSRLGRGVECSRWSPKGPISKLFDSFEDKGLATWIRALGDDADMVSTCKVLFTHFQLYYKGFEVVLAQRNRRDRDEASLSQFVDEHIDWIQEKVEWGRFTMPWSTYVPEKGRFLSFCLSFPGVGTAAAIAFPFFSSTLSDALMGSYAIASVVGLVTYFRFTLFCNEDFGDIAKASINYSDPTDSEALERLLDVCKEKKLRLQYAGHRRFRWSAVLFPEFN